MNTQINRMRLIAITGFVMMLTILHIRPAQAYWCACCAEPGQWYEESGAVHDFEFEIINQLKTYRTARLYQPASFPEALKGITDLSGDSWMEDYTVSVSQTGRRWTLSFKRKDGKNGSLVFTLPKTAVRFGVDLGANVRKEARDPVSIYKELRFKGSVWGTGIFKEGNAHRTRYLLVLQGNGNACMQETDFKTWTLEVSGPQASYRFYGAFSH